MKDLRALCQPKPKPNYFKMASNIVKNAENQIEKMILNDPTKSEYVHYIGVDDFEPVMTELRNHTFNRMTQLTFERFGKISSNGNGTVKCILVV